MPSPIVSGEPVVLNWKDLPRQMTMEQANGQPVLKPGDLMIWAECPESEPGWSSL